MSGKCCQNLSLPLLNTLHEELESFTGFGDTGGETWGIAPTFLCTKRKKENKSFKAETIKSLSPRSQCYCFRHFRASRIQKCFLSASQVADITFQCTMDPPLWNLFRQPCFIPNFHKIYYTYLKYYLSNWGDLK